MEGDQELADCNPSLPGLGSLKAVIHACVRHVYLCMPACISHLLCIVIVDPLHEYLGAVLP